ncbi:polysaccharide transport protein [Brevibacterium sp. PAMC23299]|nr:polysaccharide transport protein [Brevibacterium sp. PAMC23299]
MRTKKAVYNLTSNLVLQLINAVVGFFLLKLFITTYGSAINGLISSIKQFLTYINLVEAGVGIAAIAALYKPLAARNKNQINRILSATKQFYFRSGFIFIFLVLVLAIVYPTFVGNEVDFTLSSIMVLILGGSGIFEYFFIGKYRVLLTADQRDYVVSLIQAIGVILNALTCILLIKLECNVLLVQAVATLIYLSRVLMITSYVNRKYTYIDFNVKPDVIAISNRWDALIHQVTALVAFNTPFIIITVFLGLSEVSVFVVYSMIFASVNMLVSSFANGLLAGFGDILAKDDRTALLNGYNSFEYLFFAVLSWAYTCTAILIIPFITLYTFGITDADYVRSSIAFLFVILGVGNNIRIPPNTLVNAAAHFKETRLRAIIEASINIVMSVILVNFLGIVGVLIGGICAYAYRTTDFILYASRHILKKSPLSTIKKISRNIFLSLIAASPFVFVFEISSSSYLQLFIWAIIVAIWTMIIIFSGNYILEPNTMLDIFQRAKGVLRSPKTKI